MTIDNHLIRILLAGSLATSLIACGDSDEDNSNNTTADAGMDSEGSGDTVGGDATDTSDTDVVEVPDVTPDSDTTVEPDVADADVETDGSVEPTLGNIIEVADEAGSFTTLLAALDTADLTAVLEGEGPFTVFAPSDDAFAAFLADNELTAEELLADEDLVEILLYHVVEGTAIASADVEAGPFTTEADLTAIATTEGGVAINGVLVDTPDVQATNGVIHVIDGVLMPPTIAELAGYAGGFDTLLAAVEQEGFTETLSDADETYTVFAPTDNAFIALLAATELTAEELLAFDSEVLEPYLSLETVLGYHVIADAAVASDEVETGFVTTASGLSLYADTEAGVVLNAGPEVVVPDLMATNGIIHVIDGVLLPPNIVELAVLAGGFDTLLAAAAVAEIDEGVTVADVLSLVDAEDQITLFAPTNDAFTQLLTDLEITVDDLLADEDLLSILIHHATDGAVLSSDITPGFYRMADGNSTVIAPNEDEVLAINGAVIGPVDIVGTNGVVHVIDTVIFASDIPTLLGYHPAFTTLVTALVTADLVGAVSFDPESVENTDFTVFAPTNDAFSAFLTAQEITAEDLLASESLAEILLFHVAAEALLSGDITSLTAEGIQTLASSGELVAPVVVNGDFTISVGGALVEEADIETINGVIHVMGGVMVSDAP